MSRREDRGVAGELSSAKVAVWRVDLDSAAKPPAGILSAAEHERAAAFRDPAAGLRWATARWALRAVLAARLGNEPSEIDLKHGPHGKPELAGPTPGLGFNLSHSGGLALVALAAGPVGVDVERVKPRRNLGALAARALNAAEAEQIAGADGVRQAELFFAAWTRHEARLKCGGGGFGGPAPAGPVAVTQLKLGDGYAGAVAVPGEQPPEAIVYRLDLR